MNRQAAFLATAIQQPLLIVDSQLHCMVANPAFCGWFGGKPDVHEGVPLAELANGEFARGDVLDVLRAALHENSPRAGLIVPARETELELQVCPVMLGDEQALMIVFMRQPASSLPPISPDDEIELLWALLADGPYILFETDGKGVIHRLSAGFERLTGWPPDYWLGKSAQSMLHPDDIVRFFSPQIMIGDTWLNALRMVTRSGDYRRVEVCTYPLIGPDGNVRRVFGIGRDMTEYFVLLDRRKETESESRALFAAMDHVVIVVSRDGKIMRVLSIPERFVPQHGGDDQLSGMRLTDVLSPVLGKEALEQIDAVLSSGRPQRHEFTFEADGESLWLSAVFSPLDEQRVLIVAENITDRKEAERQAMELALTRERSDVLERLITDVSHELRSPIGVLRSSAILLDRQVRLLERKADDLYESSLAGQTGALRSQALTLAQVLTSMREQVTRLDSSVQRLQSSVETRLYEVRAEHGLGFEFSLHSPNTLIEQAAALRRADAIRRGLHMALELDHTLPPVVLDPTELARALRVLIGRVMQDAPDHAAITIRTRQEDSSVVLEVAGPVNVDPEELARLIDPAYRAERMGDQWQSSHDLAIAQRIILAHGGKVGQQTGLGGVRIWQVWLPLGGAPDSGGSGGGSEPHVPESG